MYGIVADRAICSFSTRRTENVPRVDAISYSDIVDVKLLLSHCWSDVTESGQREVNTSIRRTSSAGGRTAGPYKVTFSSGDKGITTQETKTKPKNPPNKSPPR